MSDTLSTTSVIGDSQRREHALVAYILLTIGLFTAIPLLIGAIWAMIKKSDAIGTIYHSHLVNTTRIFWWSLFWTIVGCLSIFVGIGFVVLAVTWVWAFYRTVNGLAKLLSDQSYPL